MVDKHSQPIDLSKLVSILTNSTVAIVVNDTEKILYANPSAATLFGYNDPNELIGTDFLQYFKNDDRETIKTRAKERIESKNPSSRYDVQIKTQDNSYIQVEFNLTTIEYKGKAAILNIINDISERTRIEEELSESEKRYRRLFELSPDAIVTANIEGVITSINSAANKMTGYLPEEIVGRHFSKLTAIHASDVPRYIKLFISSVRGMAPKPFELNYRHKDGSSKWAEVHIGFLEEDGKRRGIQAIMRDITTRKQVEEERTSIEESLKVSETKYRGFLDESHDGVTVNVSGELVYVNPRFSEMMGYSVEELNGLSILDLHAPKYRDMIKDRTMKRSEGEDVPSQYEVELIRKDGSLFPVEYNVSRIEYEDKRASLTFIRDITDRRQMEMDLRLINMLNDAVNRGESMQNIIELFSAQTKDIFSSTGMTVLLLSMDREHLILQNLNYPQAVVGVIERIIGGKIPPVAIPLKPGSLYLETIQSGESRIFNDPESIQALMKECTQSKILRKLVPQIYSVLGFSSVMSVPLVSEGEPIGLVDISSKGQFRELDLSRLKQLSAQVTSIIKRKLIDDELSERNWRLGERVKELRCLIGISELVERPDITLEEILTGTAHLIPPAWQHSEVTAARITLNGQMYETDEFRETKWRLSSDIKVHGETAGAVEVFYLEEMPMFDEEPFLKEERDLIKAIAERLGRIVERVSNEEEVHKRIHELVTLNEASVALIKEQTLEKALEAILEYSLSLTGSTIGYTGFINDEGHLVTPTLKGKVWDRCQVSGKSIVFKEPGGLRGRLHRYEMAVMSNDAATDPRRSGTPEGHVPIKNFLGVPIMYEGEMVGQIGVANKLGDYSDLDEGLLVTLANEASAIIQRIRQREKLDALHTSTFSLGEVSTLTELVSRTFEAIQSVLGYDNVTIGLCDEKEVSFPFFRGELLEEPFILSLDEPSITRRAIESGKTQNVGDITSDPDFINRYDEQAPVLLSELVVPISHEDTVLGVINIRTSRKKGFTDIDVELTEILARHVSLEMTHIQHVEQLAIQNTKLLELDEMKTRFIVTATHELRTPVTSILGYVDFMIDEKSYNLSDMARKDLTVVLRNANRLAALTNDLLDVQRIQTGRLEMHPKEFDLVVLVNQVVEELTQLLQEKDHILSLDIPENLMIMGDEIRISQLLINLLRNADKFTPKGGRIFLNIKTQGDQIQVRTKDTGIGLSPGDMDKLFKPFPGINHGLNVTSSGLGLSICKGIVDLHRGKIWAESEGKGKGSTFIVELTL